MSDELLTIGPVRYVRADAVLAVTPPATTYYCAFADWPASPACAEAVRRERIAALEAELHRLKTEVVAPLPQCPVCGKAFPTERGGGPSRPRPSRGARRGRRGGGAGAAYVPLLRQAPGAHPLSLSQHERHCAANPDRVLPGRRRAALADPEPTPAPAPWACAACGGTERRSISDPTRCKPCVAQAYTAPSSDRPFACRCGGPFAESLRERGLCVRCTGEYEAKIGRAA